MKRWLYFLVIFVPFFIAILYIDSLSAERDNGIVKKSLPVVEIKEEGFKDIIISECNRSEAEKTEAQSCATCEDKKIEKNFKELTNLGKFLDNSLVNYFIDKTIEGTKTVVVTDCSYNSHVVAKKTFEYNTIFSLTNLKRLPQQAKLKHDEYTSTERHKKEKTEAKNHLDTKNCNLKDCTTTTKPFSSVFSKVDGEKNPSTCETYPLAKTVGFAKSFFVKNKDGKCTSENKKNLKNKILNWSKGLSNSWLVSSDYRSYWKNFRENCPPKHTYYTSGSIVFTEKDHNNEKGCHAASKVIIRCDIKDRKDIGFKGYVGTSFTMSCESKK